MIWIFQNSDLTATPSLLDWANTSVWIPIFFSRGGANVQVPVGGGIIKGVQLSESRPTLFCDPFHTQTVILTSWLGLNVYKDLHLDDGTGWKHGLNTSGRYLDLL